MKWHVGAVVAVAAFSARGWGQGPNPAYLSQFPTVATIEKDMKAPTPIDVLAKRAGAYWQLMSFVYILAHADHREKNLTEDEKRMQAEYIHAYSAIIDKEDRELPPAPQLAWYHLHMVYQESKELRAELCLKYFSEDLRTRIYRIFGEKPPAAPATPKPDPAKAKVFETEGQGHFEAAGKLREAGNETEAKKEFAAAAEAYKKAMELDPTDLAPVRSLGLVYFGGFGQSDLALPLFQRVVASRPTDEDAIILLGMSQYNVGKPDDAMATFALDTKPTNSAGAAARAHRCMGTILGDRKKYDEQIVQLKESIRLQKDDPATWDDLGYAYVHKELYPQAIAAYKESIRLAPREGKTYGELVFAYIAVGDKASAGETLAKLKTVDPAMYEEFVKNSGGG